MTRCILFFLLLIFPAQLYTQSQLWEQLPAPSGGNIDVLLRVDKSIIAVQSFGGVYRSDNEGEEWQFLTDALSNMAVFDMIASPDQILYVIGFQGLAISRDKGRTWTLKRQQFIPSSTAFAADGSLLVGTSGRIMRSTDEGDNWTEILPDPVVTYGYKVAVTESDIWLAGAIRSGLYRSVDKGGTWSRLDGIMTNNDVISVSAMSQSVVLAGLYNSTWRSSDDGASWQAVADLDSVNVFGIVEGMDAAWYAATSRGMYVSTDQGLRWSRQPVFRRVFGLAPTAFGILAAVDGQLRTSIDAGANWWLSSDGMRVPNWNALVIPNGESSLLLGGTNSGGLYYSDDNGNSWVTADTELPYGYSVIDISAPSTDRIAVLTDNMFLLTCEQGPSAWTLHALPSTGSQIQALSARNDGGILIGDARGVVYRSVDWGNSWTEAGKIEIPGSTVNIIAMRQDVLAVSRPLYAATDRGLFRSDNDGAGWIEITPGGIRRAVVDVAVTPGASQPIRAVVAAHEHEVFRSTDRGVTWQSILVTNANMPVQRLLLTREGNVLCLTTHSLLGWRMDSGASTSYTIPEDVTALAGKDLGGRYYTATRIHGVFRTAVDILGTGRLNEPPHPVSALSIYPMPFGAGHASGVTEPVLEFSLSEASHITLVVFDAAGRMLYSRALGYREAGTHYSALAIPDLPGGAIQVVLIGDGGTISRRVLHLR
jgi:photosystem II stability/assembly factor-like uncharacterized protein